MSPGLDLQARDHVLYLTIDRPQVKNPGRPQPGRGGRAAVGGRLPTDTSGGGMSEAHVHGFSLMTGGVRQLRGTSPNRVEHAETCLVAGGEGVPTSAVILRR